MKILCPTDFSNHAHQALEEAIFIANCSKGELTIITAYTVPTSGASFLTLDQVIQENTEEDLNELLNRVKKKISDEVVLKHKIYKGSAKKLIVDHARKEGFDLIIMGTQGSSNVRNLFVGSTTKAVFKSSSIPVLAIPENSMTSSLGKSFLLALDNEVIENEQSFNIIKALYNIYKPVLKVYHVDRSEDILPIDPIVDQYLPGLIEEIIIERNKKIIDCIKKFVVDNEISLLIMLRRKKSWWEKLFIKGFTEEEFYRTRIPMLILPEAQ